MKKKKPIITYEFGTLCIEGQVYKEGETPLSEVTFNNLWDFIFLSLFHETKRQYIYACSQYVACLIILRGESTYYQAGYLELCFMETDGQ